MKYTLLPLFLILLHGSAIGQNIKLHIGDFVNQDDPSRQKIIQTLGDFLNSKDAALYENPFWLTKDFENYPFPFIDIYGVQNKGNQPNFYNADLLKIVDTENPNLKLVKLAFVGVNDSTNLAELRNIYSLSAHILPDESIRFSRSLDYNVSKWQKLQKGSITYFISPLRQANEDEMNTQLEEIETICDYFDTEPIPISYYSCINPVELFQIKGFDYTHGMYFHNTGGLIERNGHVFSGNNSELYTHEILHVYVNKLYPRANKVLDEGQAMVMGGSGNYDYAWHKENFRKHLSSNPDFLFSQHLDIYAKEYANVETSIPYMVGALTYEYVLHNFGKEKFLSLLNESGDFWEIIKKAGLTQDNFDDKLLSILQLNPQD